MEVVLIDIGSGGLPSCGRCTVPSAQEYRPLADVAADIQSFVDSSVGTSGVMLLAGAEAFSHPSLPQIISTATSAGVQRIGVQTAGGLLGIGGNAQGVLHAGVRHFELHFLPGDDAEPAPGIPGALDGVAELVRVSAAGGARIAISAVIIACRHTIQQLSSAVGELAAAGVAAVHIKVDPSAGTGPAATASVLAACDTGVVNAVWVDVSGLALPESHSMHIASGRVS